MEREKSEYISCLQAGKTFDGVTGTPIVVIAVLR